MSVAIVRTRNIKSLLLHTASVIALAGSMLTLAPLTLATHNELQADPLARCDPKLRGAVLVDCVIDAADIGNNTEQSNAKSVGSPFKISVDGETVSANDTNSDGQRRTDVGLDSLDIQVKFDGLNAKQILAVVAERRQAGLDVVRFRTSSNYARFLKNGEVRIFKTSGETDAKALDSEPVAVLAVDSSDAVEWQSGTIDLKNYSYSYRVYDAQGRIDETRLKPIVVTDVDLNVQKSAADITGDEARVRNISVYGGAVTVFGRNIPEGYDVRVFGKSIAADTSNQVLFQQILPPGDQDVDVVVVGGKGDDLAFTRQINIPQNDWFYIALADLTVGHRLGSSVVPATPGEFDQTYTKGRLAFYLKGKIQGKYLLTAAADTEEGDVKDIFRNLGKKDPRSLLRRLDPDDYYPIYGDDSTIVQDAPTSGKAYLRLERGKSHVMWGNFKTTINGTEFARIERGLYGAHATFNSEGVTTFGESKVKVEAFAAQPGTVPQRDVFDGTGGSAYFLRNQDINKGSEQVIIEVVDGLTQRILSRTSLTEGKDYRFDYIQGVIILTSPLSRDAARSTIVAGGGVGTPISRLVVNYETTPTIGDQNGLTAAVRAEGWLSDHVKIGATASQETISTDKNNKIEADLTLRATDKTSVTLEVAQSEGRGIGQSFSSDGGLNFSKEAGVGARGQKALAYRVKAVADVGEITGGKLKGTASAYYELREAGFSAVANETAKDTKIFGAHAELRVSDSVVARLGIEGADVGSSDRQYRANAELEAQISENWKLASGVTWSRLSNPVKPYSNGDRTDIAAKLTRAIDDDTNLFVFGQTTVTRSGNRLANNRIGVGGETQISERLGVSGDISYGNTGIGGGAKLTYNADEETSYYIGYKLDPDRARYGDSTKPLLGKDAGIIVAGANARLNDQTSVFSEANVDLFGRSKTLAQTYGLTFTPDKVWSTSLGMSLGSATDASWNTIDRKLFLARASYTGERLKAAASIEARFEDYFDNKLDRTSYLLQSSANWKSAENWRIMASLDALLSKSNQSSILDGDYIEASLGSTYRPIDNDKLNILFKYTYLYDLPGPQQVNANGILGPSQRSHVINADATYDINEWLSIGAKYGYRFGETSSTRLAADFKRNSAHLGILRADVRIVKNWDLMLEGRVLRGVEAKQTDYGFLAAGYRHFGDNMKVGIGYNFGRFSDDLTDLVQDDQGVFLNVIGKF